MELRLDFRKCDGVTLCAPQSARCTRKTARDCSVVKQRWSQSYRSKVLGIRVAGPRSPSKTARASSSDSESEGIREAEDVRGAIAIGLSLYEQGKYQEALEVFEKGLELPGTGMKRFRDKPRAISDGEKQSILYNVACCYSRLEDARTGLVALAGCLESGYDNANQLKRDPDLEYLRKDSRFNGLLDRFKLNAKKGLVEEFLKGFNL